MFHPRTTKTVLVGEDDTAIGEFLVAIFKTETSYQALLATDGFQALEMVKNLVPDLFILDYRLPSMNGLELYDHFQMTEELKAIPALLLSAHAPLREMKKRNISFVKKPFELEELLETIEKLLAE